MKYPPRKGTMLARSLARLLRTERITHLSFQHDAHTYRLAASIEVLRNKYDWPIVGEQRAGRTNDPTGRSASYFVYYIPLSAIQEAGSKGHDYALKVFEWEKKRIEERAATPSSKGKTTQQSNITQSYTNSPKDGDNSNGAD
jgi:hypothetical protein